jgi:histidinol-phosphate aminotransferase
VRDIAARERVLPEQVILGDVLDALGQYLAQSGGPGGEFVYSNPGFTALVDAAQPGGGVGVPVPLDATLGNDLPSLAARLNARTRAVFLVNPHNPSGTLNDAAALHELVARAAKVATALPLHFALLPVEIAAALRKQGVGAARSQNRLAVVAARASLKDVAYAGATLRKLIVG